MAALGEMTPMPFSPPGDGGTGFMGSSISVATIPTPNPRRAADVHLMPTSSVPPLYS